MKEEKIRNIMKQETELPEVAEEAVGKAIEKIRGLSGAMNTKEFEKKEGKNKENQTEAVKITGTEEKADRAEKENNREKRVTRTGGRRIWQKKVWIAGLAAVLAAGGITVCAARYLGLSSSLEKQMHITEEQKEALETSGVMDSPEVSAEDQGVTVSMQQSIVDEFTAYLYFKVEGWETPEGSQPVFEQTNVTVGGEAAGYSAHFCNIAAREETASRQIDPNGNFEGNYVLEDGSLEYLIIIYPEEEQKLSGQQVSVEFENLGVYTGEEETKVELEGEWKLDWTLKGSEDVRTVSSREALGTTGAVVTEVRISPISIRVMYEYERTLIEENIDGEYQGAGNDTGTFVDVKQLDDENQEEETDSTAVRYEEPPYPVGVKLKDGTVYLYLDEFGGGSGYVDEESDQYQIWMYINRILDPEQVESLLFIKDLPEEEGKIGVEDCYEVILEK